VPVHFGLEDGNTTLIRNTGFYKPVYTAPKPKRTSINVIIVLMLINGSMPDFNG
jgi:hypothetical protein